MSRPGRSRRCRGLQPPSSARPGLRQLTVVTAQNPLERGDGGHHSNARASSSGPFKAFITGRAECIACILKLIFVSRKKPIKINNFPGGEKNAKRLYVGQFVRTAEPGWLGGTERLALSSPLPSPLFLFSALTLPMPRAGRAAAAASLGHCWPVFDPAWVPIALPCQMLVIVTVCRTSRPGGSSIFRVLQFCVFLAHIGLARLKPAGGAVGPSVSQRQTR